jgi:Zn-dependent protease
VDAAVGAHCVDCVRAGRQPLAATAAKDLKALSHVRPSPVFAAVVGVFLAASVWAWTSPVTGDELTEAVNGGGQVGSARMAIFAMVLSGWVLSLCLHEFGHALVAFLGGDRTVAAKGYLTLDPRKYTDRNLSLLMPLVFLFLGGIGLPGGAVWINHHFIRSKRMESLMSLAGPFANIVFGALLGLPFLVARDTVLDRPAFACGLAFLAVLQFFAAALNLLPIPGLDGFGAIEPYLSRSMQQALAPVRQYSFFILFLLIFRVPALSNALWDTAFAFADRLDIPRIAFYLGQELFRIIRL